MICILTKSLPVLSSILNRSFCSFYPNLKVILKKNKDVIILPANISTQDNIRFYQDLYNPYNDDYYNSWYHHMKLFDTLKIIHYDDYIFDGE
jgi:hypothetical protein